MDLIDPGIQQYAERHSTAEPPPLREIAAYTRRHVHTPRMLSGHLQGRLLSMLSHMMKPAAILEIGTYTGYSALCLAEGLAPGGRLVTIDNDRSLEKKTKAFFAASPWAEQIDFRLGDAAAILPTLTGSFDLVFIDADKKNYTRYYDMVMNKLTKGGHIIADNLLWSGKVLSPEHTQDDPTRALAAFAEKVQADPRVANVLLPIRDGLMVLRKQTD